MKLIVQKLYNNKRIYHYLFWILIILSYFVAHIDYIPKLGLGYYLLTTLLRHLILMMLVYGNINYLLPNYYKKKKYSLYAALLLASIAAFIGLQFFYIELFEKTIIDPRYIREILNFSFWDSLPTALRFTVFSMILKLSIDWYDQNDSIKNMKIEKLQTDINYLRSQINPHFLFNTLNSIYALSLKKSDEAPNAVILLSKMMNYMLYESSELFVSLKMEMDYLKNYIEIEKLRMGILLRIDTDFENPVPEVFVVPHIFLPFVENAFKHGSDNNTGNIEISIALHVLKKERICFTIINSLGENERVTGEGKRLGLKNARKRLDLFYKDQYELVITQTRHEHSVMLSLPAKPMKYFSNHDHLNQTNKMVTS